jgi:hypothetical protein
MVTNFVFEQTILEKRNLDIFFVHFSKVKKSLEQKIFKFCILYNKLVFLLKDQITYFIAYR